MKTAFTVAFVLALSFAIQAQYVQNFDTLSHGDFIAMKDLNWTTWNNNPGSIEDAQVDSTQASSGNNALLFQSSLAAGGPQDVVVHFTNTNYQGKVKEVEYAFKMFVATGHGGYFNIQPKQYFGLPSFQFWLNQNGQMIVTDDGSRVLDTVNYPMNSWFNLSLKLDLNTNSLSVYLNGTLSGIHNFKLASQSYGIDFYPINNADYGGNGQAKFWVDDVSLNAIPFTKPNLNLAVDGFKWNGPVLTNTIHSPNFFVVNLGKQVVNSFEYKFEYNGDTIVRTVSGFALDSGQSYEFRMAPGFTLANGNNRLKISLTKVNGLSGDDFLGDNQKELDFYFLKATKNKVVLLENLSQSGAHEGIHLLAQHFNHGMAKHIQCVTVHTNDGMALPSYYNSLANDCSPSRYLANRADSPQSYTSDFKAITDFLEAPSIADLEIGSQNIAQFNQLKISVTYTFNQAHIGKHRVACIIAEDSVTGNTTAFNRYNSLSGFTVWQSAFLDQFGQDYTLLPDPIPYTDAVFYNVARAINPSYFGSTTVIPDTVSAGSTYIGYFNFPRTPLWDTNHIKVIAILLDDNYELINAGGATILEAKANGFNTGQHVSVQEFLSAPNNKVVLYPNPSNLGYVILSIQTKNEPYDIVVIDVLGKEVYKTSESQTETSEQLRIETRNWKSGIYFIQVQVGSHFETHKLVLE